MSPAMSQPRRHRRPAGSRTHPPTADPERGHEMAGIEPQDQRMTTTGSDRSPALQRLAEGCYRRRRVVLAVWLLLVIGLSALGGAAAGELDNEFGLPGSESQEAFDRLEQGGFGDRAG